MYSTVSMAAYRQACRDATSAVRFPPPDEYSAYLLLDDDDETTSVSCFGISGQRGLPFPQDKCLQFEYKEDYYKYYFVPVLGKPIFSHCYYVVRANGSHKGLVETCSTDEGVQTFCWRERRTVNDIQPRPLQPINPYQHIQIIQKYDFESKCTAADGFPPKVLRKRDWTPQVRHMRGHHYRLAHVGGENTDLRAQPPPFDFSLLERTSPVVIVGEWYCPFIFITEMGTKWKDCKIQLMECPFYKMVLEKFWEEIYYTQCMAGKDVDVEKTLIVEEALLYGEEVVEEIRDNDGSVLFKGVKRQSVQTSGVKLSWPIIAKMRVGQDKYGSRQAGGEDVRLKKSFPGIGNEGNFACYVEVERYVLKRMDGSVALSCSFRNSNQIKGKWELSCSF